MLPRGTPHTVSLTRDPGDDIVPFADLLKAHMIGRHGDHPIELTYGTASANATLTQLFSLHLDACA